MKKRFNINYPEDFHDFSNGVDISTEEINERISQCIDRIKYQIEEDPERGYYHTFIRSGNTYVNVTAYKQEDDENEYEISAIVSKAYQEFNDINIEL